MTLIEIIVIIACILIVGGVIVSRIIAKKKGKSCCDCENCPHSNSCHKMTKNK